MSEGAPSEVQTAVIVVDGQQKSVSSREVTWAEVVDLAYPGQRSEPDKTFIVTFSEAEQSQHQGLLAEGGEVHVKKEGTVFNVVTRRRS